VDGPIAFELDLSIAVTVTVHPAETFHRRGGQKGCRLLVPTGTHHAAGIILIRARTHPRLTGSHRSPNGVSNPLAPTKNFNRIGPQLTVMVG